MLYTVLAATKNTDAGEQAYFNVSVVGEELLFTVVTPDLSLNHDCGVFELYTQFLYLVYDLKCANGETTTIQVTGASILICLGASVNYIRAKFMRTM